MLPDPARGEIEHALQASWAGPSAPSLRLGTSRRKSAVCAHKHSCVCQHGLSFAVHTREDEVTQAYLGCHISEGTPGFIILQHTRRSSSRAVTSGPGVSTRELEDVATGFRHWSSRAAAVLADWGAAKKTGRPGNTTPPPTCPIRLHNRRWHFIGTAFSMQGVQAACRLHASRAGLRLWVPCWDGGHPSLGHPSQPPQPRLTHTVELQEPCVCKPGMKTGIQP